MYLKKLTLSGFKSFADTTEFEFHQGTTVVVGPNGCGKSNVVDAFRWVLGERSARGLRGQEMLDVIFKGTRNRDALSRAEVLLLFDNADGRLPIEFQEVEVGRRLYRSGESEYLFNGRSCRLKDIRRLFADTGIGTTGYSILEQGSVDGILHCSPQDRRTIFEEAAGISLYKEQKLQSLRQLDRTRVNTERLRDILAEVERRVRSVKIQAGKAKRYLEDRDQFIRLRAVLADIDLRDLRSRREELTFRLALLQLRRTFISTAAERLETERETCQRAVQEANEAVNLVRDREMQVRMAQERVTERRHHIAERREEIARAAAVRAEQREELVDSRERAVERRVASRERMREQIGELRVARVGFEAAATQREELGERKGTLERELSEAKEDVVSHIFTETRLSNERTAHESEQRGLEAMRERRAQEAEEFEAGIEEHQGIQEAIRADLEQSRLDSEEAQGRLVLIREELERRRQLLSETQRTLSELRERYEANQARLRFLEELEQSREGISEGARRLLARDGHPAEEDVAYHGPGEPPAPDPAEQGCGLLAGLVDADPGVAPLVDAVLGSHAETVVFRDTSLSLEERVREIERVLDDEGVSVCHVGPWGEPGAPVPFPGTPAPGWASGGSASPPPVGPGQRLFDLIRCDPRHRRLLLRLLGNVFVVDSFPEALQASERGDGRRYITWEGLLVEPWGAVTIPSAKEGGLISRRAEIHQLRQLAEERARELEQISDDALNLELGIAARTEERDRLEEERQRAALEAENLERRLTASEEEIQRLQSRLQVVRGEITEIEESTRRIAARRAEVAEELERKEQERHSLEERIRAEETELAQISSRLQEVDDDLSHRRVEATQKEERILGLRREERGIAAEIEERVERLRWLDREDETDATRLQSCDEEENRLGEEEERLTTQAAEVADAAEAARRGLEETTAQQDATEKLGRVIRRHEEELRAGREGDLLEENEARLGIESIREKFVEEFEQELTAVPLQEWRDELLQEDEEGEAFVTRLRKDVSETQERLRKNSSVNLEAVHELTELEEREVFLRTQIEDLTEAEAKLEATIEELNKKSRDRFFETFEVVRNHFQELFAKIFGGGVADLILEEDVDVLEAGVEIRARPPGKRISSLRLLSGGEKALTAISLLFALFRRRPSPFCLLDEVDAPLDEANVRRFVRILGEFTGEVQFLIITHNKATMAEGEFLYGVTMEEEGVSRRVAVRLEDVDELEGEKPKGRRMFAARRDGRPEVTSPEASGSRLPPEDAGPALPLPESVDSAEETTDAPSGESGPDAPQEAEGEDEEEQQASPIIAG